MMTKRSNKRVSRVRNNSRRNPEVTLLKEIRESLISTQTSSEPDVKDVILSRLKPNKIYNFEFTATSLISASAVAEVDGAISFTLNTLTGYTSMTSLFDQYRIVGVQLQFLPSQNSYTAAAGAIFTAFDYDDATPVVLSTLYQRQTLKATPAGVYFERSLKPRIALAAYAGAFTSFANVGDVWIDSASPAVVYYGLKYGIPATASAPSWTVKQRYMIQCRSQI
jgi:hypothetical protein